MTEPVEKSDRRGYVPVQRQLVVMRRAGLLPYAWITDSTRRGYFVTTYNHPADAVAEVARFYRRSYWASSVLVLQWWVAKGGWSWKWQSDRATRHALAQRPPKRILLWRDAFTLRP
jgi:hypothetical protein